MRLTFRQTSTVSRRTIFTRKTLLDDAALASTALALLALVGLSQITLEAFGYTYISAGGPFWQKVHPATLLTLLALVLRCLATKRPLATAARILSDDAGILLYLAALAITACFAVVVAKAPVTPLIDTFILPLLFYWLLRDLDSRIAKGLAIALAVILAVNAVIALAEFLTNWRLVMLDVPEGVTADPTRGDAVFDWRADLATEWRATALLGPPIGGAGIVGSFIVCLAVSGGWWLPRLFRLPLLALQIVSMFAYGARLSLVMSIAIVVLIGCYEGAVRFARGVRPTVRSWALALGLVPLAILGVFLVIQIGIFDRTLDRFTHDAGSATTRITMFRLFEPIPWESLLVGPDQGLVQTWQRLEGLEFGIESSWIGLTLTYGVLVTAMLVVGLAAFMRAVALAAGRGAWLVEAFFLVILSTSTGLAGKSTSLALVTVLILLFVRREASKPAFQRLIPAKRVKIGQSG